MSIADSHCSLHGDPQQVSDIAVPQSVMQIVEGLKFKGFPLEHIAERDQELIKLVQLPQRMEETTHPQALRPAAQEW